MQDASPYAESDRHSSRSWSGCSDCLNLPSTRNKWFLAWSAWNSDPRDGWLCCLVWKLRGCQPSLSYSQDNNSRQRATRNIPTTHGRGSGRYELQFCLLPRGHNQVTHADRGCEQSESEWKHVLERGKRLMAGSGSSGTVQRLWYHGSKSCAEFRCHLHDLRSIEGCLRMNG